MTTKTLAQLLYDDKSKKIDPEKFIQKKLGYYIRIFPSALTFYEWTKSDESLEKFDFMDLDPNEPLPGDLHIMDKIKEGPVDGYDIVAIVINIPSIDSRSILSIIRCPK